MKKKKQRQIKKERTSHFHLQYEIIKKLNSINMDPGNYTALPFNLFLSNNEVTLDAPGACKIKLDSCFCLSWTFTFTSSVLVSLCNHTSKLPVGCGISVILGWISLPLKLCFSSMCHKQLSLKIVLKLCWRWCNQLLSNSFLAYIFITVQNCNSTNDKL